MNNRRLLDNPETYIPCKTLTRMVIRLKRRTPKRKCSSSACGFWNPPRGWGTWPVRWIRARIRALDLEAPLSILRRGMCVWGGTQLVSEHSTLRHKPHRYHDAYYSNQPLTP